MLVSLKLEILMLLALMFCYFCKHKFVNTVTVIIEYIRSFTAWVYAGKWSLPVIGSEFLAIMHHKPVTPGRKDVKIVQFYVFIS
jgi:hypothetical protein